MSIRDTLTDTGTVKPKRSFQSRIWAAAVCQT